MIDEQIRTAFQAVVDETPPAPDFRRITRSPAPARWSPILTTAVAAGVVLALFVAPSLLDPSEPGDAGTMPPPVTTTVSPVTTLAPGVMIPDVVGMTLGEAVRVLSEVGIHPFVDNEALGDDVTVVAITPNAGEIWSGEDVLLSTETAPEACQDYEWEPPQPADEIAVWYPCGPADDIATMNFKPTERDLPVGGDEITVTIRHLLAGPSDYERSIGFSSFFGPGTADALESVDINGGAVIVDFNDAIRVNNASTSSGSVGFNAELRHNIFQYEYVESVEFRINGSCEAWSAFFQSDGCWVVNRADWESGGGPP